MLREIEILCDDVLQLYCEPEVFVIIFDVVCKKCSNTTQISVPYSPHPMTLIDASLHRGLYSRARPIKYHSRYDTILERVVAWKLKIYSYSL